MHKAQTQPHPIGRPTSPATLAMIGKRFGRLLVTGIGPVKHQHRSIACQCDCGNAGAFSPEGVRKGKTVSCGCYGRDNSRHLLRGNTNRLTHGGAVRGAETAAHRSWRAMRARCLNPKFRQFKDYGGRGIAVCERWNSFQNFLDDMGERPEKTTLDRINPNGNYEPSNCRWADAATQRRNTRSAQ